VFPPKIKLAEHPRLAASLARFAEIRIRVVPAMIGAVFFFTAPEQFQSARCLRMRASNQDGAE
jgi:hypothetical protein